MEVSVLKSHGEWCLVANVIAQPFGENHQIQKGTKHFSPNIKVYCSAPHWGDGYALIYALVLREVAEVYQAIERGADVNYRLRHDGITPLTAALCYCLTIALCRHNLIQLLLENGADIKTINYQLIESVTHNPSQYPDCVVRLVEQAIDELFPHSRTIDQEFHV